MSKSMLKTSGSAYRAAWIECRIHRDHYPATTAHGEEVPWLRHWLSVADGHLSLKASQEDVTSSLGLRFGEFHVVHRADNNCVFDVVPLDAVLAPTWAEVRCSDEKELDAFIGTIHLQGIGRAPPPPPLEVSASGDISIPAQDQSTQTEMIVDEKLSSSSSSSSMASASLRGEDSLVITSLNSFPDSKVSATREMRRSPLLRRKKVEATDNDDETAPSPSAIPVMEKDKELPPRSGSRTMLKPRRRDNGII
eukprot:PhM_4_TR10468/c0_g1_i1/m.17712